MKNILKSRLNRLIISALVYVVIIGILGAHFYGYFYNDISAAFFGLGIGFGPIALLILWPLDRYLSKKVKYGWLTLLLCGLCLPIYYLSLKVMVLIMVLGKHG